MRAPSTHPSTRGCLLYDPGEGSGRLTRKAERAGTIPGTFNNVNTECEASGDLGQYQNIYQLQGFHAATVGLLRSLAEVNKLEGPAGTIADCTSPVPHTKFLFTFLRPPHAVLSLSPRLACCVGVLMALTGGSEGGAVVDVVTVAADLLNTGSSRPALRKQIVVMSNLRCEQQDLHPEFIATVKDQLSKQSYTLQAWTPDGGALNSLHALCREKDARLQQKTRPPHLTPVGCGIGTCLGLCTVHCDSFSWMFGGADSDTTVASNAAAVRDMGGEVRSLAGQRQVRYLPTPFNPTPTSGEPPTDPVCGVCVAHEADDEGAAQAHHNVHRPIQVGREHEHPGACSCMPHDAS